MAGRCEDSFSSVSVEVKQSGKVIDDLSEMDEVKRNAISEEMREGT